MSFQPGTNTTFEEIKKQSEELTKAKNFAGALPLCEKLCTEYSDKCSEWEWWRYGQCLRKAKRNAEALDACRKAYTLNKVHKAIRGLYAWSIFDCEIKGKETLVEADLSKAVEGIGKLTSSDDPMSPYAPAVFALVDHLEKQGKTEKMLHWTSKLKPESLSTEASSFKTKEGKLVKVASHREKWYSLHTKALLENDKHDECAELCKKALEELSVFHNDNDIWFKRRIAKCEMHRKNYDTALKLFEEIHQKKKDWFVQFDIAGVHLAKNDKTKAMKYALNAALSPAAIEFKGDLFLFLANLMSESGEAENAALHLLLNIRIREEKKWKVSDDLHNKATQFGVDLTDSRTSEQLHQVVKKIWEQRIGALDPPQTGRIKKILENGKGGFIETADGNSFYFSMKSVVGSSKNAVIGADVTFNLEDGFDKKKNIPSKVAVNIHLKKMV